MTTTEAALPLPVASPGHDKDWGLAPSEVEAVMGGIYARGDRLMGRFVLSHVVLSIALAPFYQTWLITAVWGGISAAAFFLTAWLFPGRFITRAMAGIVLESFCALHIWQMHGQAEQHFWFFIGFTMMIVYHDWLCMWPGALLIILQHTVFAYFHNQGLDLHFFPEHHISVLKLVFHFGIAAAHVAVCGYWGWLLRQQRLRDAAQKAELTRSRSRLQDTIGAARMAPCEIDPAAGLLVDPADADSLFGGGSRSGSATLAGAFDNLHPDDAAAVEEAVSTAMTTGAPIRFTFRVPVEGDEPRWFAVQGQRTDQNGRVRLLGMISEITERIRTEDRHRRLELKVQQSQKLESLGVLAGGIAHDFNNLLTAVIGNIGFLKETMAGSPVEEDTIANIETAALRAADLTRQMLAYSGRGRFVISAVQLSEVAREMTTLLGSVISKNAELRMELNPDLPAVEADRSQVGQVMMNLITNAAEALDGATGMVTVKTGIIAVDRVWLAQAQVGDDAAEGLYLYLEVADTGHGMSAETLARIFDPFYTTKFTGRGLGLAAVHGIVRGHAGAIRVDSTAGRGTRVTVLFPPAAAPTPALPAFQPATVDEWRGSGTVLVIDDEDGVNRVSRRILERKGFTVLSAKDGFEGLQLFEQCNGSLRMVLVDKTMPGMSGTEVAAEMARRRPGVPVVLTSGYDESAAAGQMTILAGFLQKPFQPNDLLAIVRRVLEAQPVA